MATRAHDFGAKGTAYRDAVVHTLLELMEHNDKVLCLDADLGGASGTLAIAKKRPSQFIDLGIAEQNMMGMAAGMSSEGYIPFCHTFGPFATRRCFDQIFLAGGYSHNTINIWGSDPGFTAGANGGTHTTWEDVALMRMIPQSVVVDAADAVQMAWILKEFASRPGVNYVRSGRKDAYKIYEEGSTFELGHGTILREGTDVLIVSAGQLLKDAMDAANTLADEGVSVELIDMFCIKPFDTELLLSEAAGKKAVVTFENHSIEGGLGSICAETLMEAGVHVPFKRHGVYEEFGQVGTASWLQAAFHLTSDDLVHTVHGLLA